MARILVVDDNADERHIYSIVLTHSGHVVEEAAEAATGIERARTTQPDLIVLDVYMPVMNGLLAAEVLRSTPSTAHIPLVCVTGYDINPRLAEAAGFNRFLKKPVAPRLLIETVSSLLASRPEAPPPPQD